MSKHTPAPWTVAHRGQHSYQVTASLPGMVCAKDIVLHTSNPADAALIAAAPDLLEALQFALESFDPDTEAFMQARRKELLTRVQAAIAKAEGKS